MKKLTIIKKAHHRNGVKGNGFAVVLFKDKDNPQYTFVATLFEEIGNCSILAIEELVALNIEFGCGNSWRSESFEKELREQLNEYFK